MFALHRKFLFSDFAARKRTIFVRPAHLLVHMHQKETSALEFAVKIARLV